MTKITFLIMLITIASKISGFGRDVVLSYFYGVSSIADAYLIALTIPGTIFSFVVTGVTTSFIPMYSNISQEKSIDEADKFASNILNGILIICTIIIFVVWIFTPQIVKLFASGFKDEILKLAVGFTKISITGIYFNGLISVFVGYLQIKNQYIVPAFIGIPLNIIIVCSILLSAVMINPAFLPVGNVIATASQLLFILPFIYKQKFSYKLVLDYKDKYTQKILYLALPVILGVSVDQINVLVDRTIASQIAVGGIAALNYANKLNMFIQGIFVLSVTTVMYPKISKMAAERRMSEFKKTISTAIDGISLLIFPVTAGSMFFAEPIVKLLFGRGAFDAQAIDMTSSALLFFSVGMIGFGLRDVLCKAFYSLQDTRTPMVNAALALITNIILNITLSKILGIGGLALATSISAIFCTILLIISLQKKIGSFNLKYSLICCIKVLAVSILIGIFAKLSYLTLTVYVSANISLLLSFLLGAILYMIIIYLLKIPAAETLILAVKNELYKLRILHN